MGGGNFQGHCCHFLELFPRALPSACWDHCLKQTLPIYIFKKVPNSRSQPFFSPSINLEKNVLIHVVIMRTVEAIELHSATVNQGPRGS
jgi:hypothetical protein